MGILDDAIREHLELKRRHGADSQEVSRQEREILGAAAAEAEAAAPAYDEAAAAAAPAGDDEFVVDLGDDLPPAAAPLAGSPLVESEPEPGRVPAAGDLFPGTGELLAAASETPVAPPEPPRPAAPLAAPAPADADSETAARSGARRLSDDELAAWRRRLSERADRLAAQRPAAGGPATAAGASGGAASPPPAAAAPTEPPAYWSGNASGADAGAPPPAPRVPAPPAPKPAHEPEPPADGVPVDFFDAGDVDGAFAPEPAPEPTPDESEHDVLDETPDFLQETPEHDRMWFEQRPPRDFDFG